MAKSKHLPKTQAPWSYLTSLGLGLGILALASTQVRAIWPGLPPQTGRMVVSQLAQQQQPRTALIIANYAYGGDDELAGPRQDAMAMYKKLKSLGFDVPPPVTNATKQQMRRALQDFVERMVAKGPGGVNVFYYSGHGVQIEGVNYLLPVELAAASSETDVKEDAVTIDYVVNKMYSVVHDFNFLIIDACRNNPYYSRWGRPTKGSVNQGLTSTRPPRGTMIAYAAEENKVALDGVGGKNSPFTASLLNYLSRPDLTIYQLLHRVQKEVETITNGEQIPSWEGYPRTDEIALNPSTTVAPRPTPEPARPTPMPSPTLISAVTGVNYQPLRDALVAKDYRLANETTRNLMLRAAGREPEGWFHDEDLEKFSCTDLKMIDQLWLDHSNGKFGFSVQQRIYRNLGGTPGQYDGAIYERFGDQVGWRKNNNWLWYDELDWRAEAPNGHLPVVGVKLVLLLDNVGRLGGPGLALPSCGRL